VLKYNTVLPHDQKKLQKYDLLEKRKIFFEERDLSRRRFPGSRVRISWSQTGVDFVKPFRQKFKDKTYLIWSKFKFCYFDLKWL
jgi:hypothetical protein